MSLIKCKECGKEISDKATTCIHCGCPTNFKKEKEEKTINIQKENVATEQKKKSNILDVFRYILGVVILLISLIGGKGIGMLILLLSVICILPISANYIYSKINVPKVLKIIIPIILFIIGASISGGNDTTTNIQNNQSAYCSKTTAKGSNRYSVKITGNSKKTEVKGQEIYDSELVGEKICGYQKTMVSYYGGGVECGKSKGSDDYIIQYSYTTIDDIQKVIKDLENEDYECSLK